MTRPAALALIALVLVSACRPKGSADKSLILDDEAGSTDPLADAKAFRQTFAAFTGGGEYLTIGAKPALAKAPEAETAEAFFETLHGRYLKETPGTLLAADEERTVAPAAESPSMLAAHPVTIVVFPGFSSEFIDTRAFEEAFARTGSSFRKAWDAALADHAGKPEATDSHYDLTALGEVEAPLGDLVNAASIDGDDGQPLVKILLLNTPYFSLESLGGTEGEAAILLRRLDKALTVLPPSDAVAFLGYSRGTPLALDALAHASDKAWFDHVKAVISLGGVTYGSDVADDLNREGSPTQKEVALLRNLAQQLKPLDGLSTAQHVLQFKRNTAAWASFLTAIAQADPTMSLSSLENRAKGSDVRSGISTLGRFWKTYGLNNPAKDYSNNIRRFQALAKAVIDGATSLTTADRFAWWRSHTVPTQGISFLSVTATMADPDAGAAEKAFMENGKTFLPDSPDDRFLMDGYRGMVKASGGITINDSQMVAYKSRFWAEVAPLLNPAQPPLKVRWLGLVGTHHWGLALQVVNKPTAGGLNPFPRVAMLEALAREVGR